MLRHNLFLFVLLFSFVQLGLATSTIVTSQTEFDAAEASLSAGDTIVWASNTYANIFMDIEKDGLVVMSEELGSVTFTRDSKAVIDGDNVHFVGFQYVDGDIGGDNVIDISGSNLLITQVNIAGYTCNKYLRVREASQYVDITYCNFELKRNSNDQNILSLLVDRNEPGYHRVRYCSFRNFPGAGNDEGIEPIRIGVSSQADFISRCVVEYCYFTQCNGDGEIISSKATENVYRYNTFEDNPVAELVLRHGSSAIVYGNFFLDNKGGIRVREGQNHYIYNNYFEDIGDRPIYLQNEASDPLDNINIAFNTIVDCDDLRLGRSGSNPPTNVTFSNNIFTDPKDGLFENATGTEAWIGNLSFGDLGITRPASGIQDVDPQLIQNAEGFYELSATSPAIDAAQTGFSPLPNFVGVDSIDVNVDFDLMQQVRPTAIASKDVGSGEFPHTRAVSPYATSENSGPFYMETRTSNTGELSAELLPQLTVFPNPVQDVLTIRLPDGYRRAMGFEVRDLGGRVVLRRAVSEFAAESPIQTLSIDQLSSGYYLLHATDAAIGSVPFVKK